MLGDRFEAVKYIAPEDRVSTSMLYCPQCESEFLASASECVDCGVALVADLAAAVHDQMPPTSELSLVRAASVGWAQALSERLAEAGISHRIEAVGGDDEDETLREQPSVLLPYGVWVLEADLSRARGIDEEFLRGQIPDLPAQGSDLEHGDDRCPACGEELSPSASECPGCGLALLAGE